MTDIGIIYLQKDKFDFYSPLIGRIIEFRFVPEIVKDLDVINPDLLENLIKLFIASNKIPPASLIIVIADSASFINDFQVPNVPPSNPQAGSTQPPVSHPISSAVIDGQIKFFIEHVPFDEVESQTYPMSNGIKAWATNKELYGSIASAFEKEGFDVKVVLPGVVFEGNISSKDVFDLPMALNILQNFDTVRQHSLLTQKPAEFHMVESGDGKEAKKNEETWENIEVNDNPKTGTNKKRLFAMVGVFVILIIILIFVYLGSLQQTP